MSRNIYKNADGYIILRQNNKKLSYYGKFKTLEEAEEYKKYLIKNDWDEKLAKRQRRKQTKELKYIQKIPNNHYVVKKRINGKNHYEGMYNTLDETIMEVRENDE